MQIKSCTFNLHGFVIFLNFGGNNGIGYENRRVY